MGPRAVVGALLAAALVPGVSVAAQEHATAAEQEPIAIGLVVPAGSGGAGALAAEVRAAAEAAIAAANRDGGYRGRPFALRVVNEEGLWGQGLGRVVSLAFDGPIHGLIGGLDGRSAHLIQQVIIKARVPFLTPWAGDPTLSRGGIPWFFQVVPDDRRQATTLVAGADEVILVADTAYDNRRFAEAVGAAADSAGVGLRRIDAAGGPAAVAELVSAATADRSASAPVRVILATDEESAGRVVERLAALPRPPTVGVPLRIAGARVGAAATRYGGRVLTAAVESDPGRTGTVAREPAAAGVAPAARHTREAVEALVAAIRVAGLDLWRIRAALADASARGGAGPAFDGSGRRLGSVALVEVASLLGATHR